MTDRYREMTPSGPVIHCGPYDGNDYTLCGYALEGEASRDGGCEEPTMVTRGKINCDRCVALIQFAKKVPARLLASPPTAQREGGR